MNELSIRDNIKIEDLIENIVISQDYMDVKM